MSYLGLMSASPPRSMTLRLPSDHSPLHHQPDLAERGNRASRVSLDSDEIGHQARLDGTQPTVEPEHLGSDRRGRLEGLGRLHSEFDHELDLAGTFTVREDPHVAAIDNDHASVARLLE